MRIQLTRDVIVGTSYTDYGVQPQTLEDALAAYERDIAITERVIDDIRTDLADLEHDLSDCDLWGIRSEMTSELSLAQWELDHQRTEYAMLIRAHSNVGVTFRR